MRGVFSFGAELASVCAIKCDAPDLCGARAVVLAGGLSGGWDFTLGCAENVADTAVTHMTAHSTTR